MDSSPGARITNLRATLLAIFSGQESNAQLNSLVAICHSLACVHLSGKRSAWRMMGFHGINNSDLAYDCIAELFRRDDAGALIELITYFRAFDVAQADDAELLASLRRLVCAKANSRLYRSLAETDPSLARIIRNIKVSIQSMGHFTETFRFGEPYLVPASVDPLPDLPLPTPEEVEQYVWEVMKFSQHIPDLLARISRILGEQSERSRQISLFVLALSVKKVMESQLPPAASAQPELSHEEAMRIVEDACIDARNKFHATYVDTGKLSADVLETYIQAAKAALIRKTIMDDGHDFSLFKSLGQHIPGLDEECYRIEHKSKIEYIARYINQRAAQHMNR